MKSCVRTATVVAWALVFSSCSGPQPTTRASKFTPSEVIDLGAPITEDLPQRVWGPAFMKQMGFTRPNSFDVIRWTFPVEGGSISGSNAYYTLFNHGGPHVDAPNHVGEAGGIDAYPVDAFAGPAKVFDVSSFAVGRSVPLSVFRGQVEQGDIVLLHTRYAPPKGDTALPEVITLTNEAADFLATLPVRAIGTDAFGIESLGDTAAPWIHHVFLSRRIPVFEQLFNVDALLTKQNMFFVGVPLNVAAGDGMIVRPVVFVY